MICPYCGSDKLKVIDKRDNNETNTTRRRRECETCRKRFTTYERIEKLLMNVIKRDGGVEEFDREKMRRGIYKAVKKRPISEEQISEILDNVEQALLSKGETTVRTIDIGELVLTELTKIDKLGALLFAAVYKEFQTLEDVQEQLEKLSKKK